MSAADAEWFEQHTLRAPARLRQRAAELLAPIPVNSGRTVRLAEAGRQALDSAMAAGSDRAAALDLLVADGLITLALLAAAEADSPALGATARTLRLGGMP